MEEKIQELETRIGELEDELKDLNLAYDIEISDHKDTQEELESANEELHLLEEQIIFLEKKTEKLPQLNTLYDEEKWELALNIYEKLNLIKLQKIYESTK